MEYNIVIFYGFVELLNKLNLFVTNNVVESHEMLYYTNERRNKNCSTNVYSEVRPQRLIYQPEWQSDIVANLSDRAIVANLSGRAI